MPGVQAILSSETDDWLIANDRVACRARMIGGQLYWEVIDRATGRAAIGPSPAPRLQVNRARLEWDGPARATAEEQPDGSLVLRVEAAALRGDARVARLFQVWPGHPFVRAWGAVENTGAQDWLVTFAEILRLEFAPPPGGPPVLFHVDQFSWAYRGDFFSQHQAALYEGRAAVEVRMGSFPSHHTAPTSCAWFALRGGPPDRPGEAPHAGAGFVCGIEFNGKSRLRAWSSGGIGCIASTIDDLSHLVAPSETFDAPAFFVGLFDGDWDEAGHATQRFAEAHVHPPMPDARYPWAQYNSWGYGQDIHEAQQLAAIERCAELGVEVAVMDLGWAAQIGEWRAHPARFPRGLAPLADRAHALGLKFGLHLPLAQANVDSPVARQHPDWLIHRGDDYFGAAPLCLGHPPCREWLIGEIVRLIDDYHVDYFVQDGEDMVKTCHAEGTACPIGDANYTNSVEGIDRVIETVRRLRPNVVWENCEDGGCMLTYKMGRLYHTTITVDNIATYATRQGVYGASYPFSPRYSVRYMQDDPTPYTLRSAIFGGPLILMQRVTEWSAAQMEQTRAAIAEYKQLRGLVRDARIVHLLPPRHNVGGLGWGWDAIQAVSPDRSRSVVMVYRAAGGPQVTTIRPRGLRPDGRYRVAWADAGTALEAAGAALAAEGVQVSLGEMASEMLTLTLAQPA